VTWSRPAAFASYIAMSASTKSSSQVGVEVSRPNIAMQWSDRNADPRIHERGTEARFALPIIGICGNGRPRYELLLCLRTEDGDLIPPGAFMNAERFGLMGDIDRWVLRSAIRLLHDHEQAGHDFCLAVNVSGKTMNHRSLADDLHAMLAELPIAPQRLTIEITETAAIVNIERACRLGCELRELGCQFALDDFGAVFSSFYYLKHLDFDYLKIDGEFIQKLPHTRNDQLVVTAVVDIAHGLNVKTIAEFVGDQDTADLLKVLGVDYEQGYHLGRPWPLADRLPALTA
jgi:EAL domain-containing protein (putative c-di-GMP-specific phosphodiesterase class I)